MSGAVAVGRGLLVLHEFWEFFHVQTCKVHLLGEIRRFLYINNGFPATLRVEMTD